MINHREIPKETSFNLFFNPIKYSLQPKQNKTYFWKKVCSLVLSNKFNIILVSVNFIFSITNFQIFLHFSLLYRVCVSLTEQDHNLLAFFTPNVCSISSSLAHRVVRDQRRHNSRKCLRRCQFCLRHSYVYFIPPLWFALFL